ncbi:hypothetical protein ACGFIF_28930 [Kribbella sp. NPDC049174]|uniref:hypothetical protein n=1 Tax=Kribbella sp. NPDC049174 TaxID=3364112 RepID=UPI00371312B1
MPDGNDPRDLSSADAFGLPAVQPGVPVAAPIAVDTQQPEGDTPQVPSPDPASPDLPSLPVPQPPHPPIPPFKPCNLGFRDGCYAVTFRPKGALRPLVGTLRIDRGAPEAGPDGVIVSGDLYLGAPPWVVHPDAAPSAGSVAATLSRGDPPFELLPIQRIPIYPRNRYHSYLSGTRLVVPAFTIGNRPCQVTIDVDQYDYTQPPAGSFEGSFPASPSRSLRFVLHRASPPFPLPSIGGPRFQGRVFQGTVDRGSITLTWVSAHLRRAVLEIDVLTGAVAPAPVPHPSGTGTEYFDTVFAGARWDLTVVEDQVDVPVPTGVDPNVCWSSGNLHDLMTAVRKPTTNLDAEWRTHLVVVPAAMGCSRGVMYDQIDVPREGSASFSDDGYPASHSSNFGDAEDEMQRDVPRAFLRSASHEVTHAFNQIHQESETAADNSIMTTTPSVADVLGGPTTGAPGVFPDQINLGFNTTVRNHLAHMPDPVIRPGGWPFASWFPSGAPQAGDRELFDPSELSLEVSVDTAPAAFGAPVTVTWTLTNTSNDELIVPNDVRLEGLFATMTVTDDRGDERPVRPFVIECETVRLAPLAPGEHRTASYRLFWSSAGFALDRPGRHLVTVAVAWSASGIPVGVVDNVELWVDHPTNDLENRDASLAMNPEVGKWVALGGDAYHLTEAVERLSALAGGGALPGVRAADDAQGRSRVAEAFAGLLPTRDAGLTDSTAKRSRRAPAKKSSAAKPAKKPRR